MVSFSVFFSFKFLQFVFSLERYIFERLMRFFFSSFCTYKITYLRNVKLFHSPTPRYMWIFERKQLRTDIFPCKFCITSWLQKLFSPCAFCRNRVFLKKLSEILLKLDLELTLSKSLNILSPKDKSFRAVLTFFFDAGGLAFFDYF